MLKKNTIIVAILLASTACVPSTYTPPSSLNSDKNTFLISKNYDDTWSSLIDYVTSGNYSVENFEKASGLIILYFGKDNPEQYVDCGLFNNQPYVNYLTKEYKSALVGQMSIAVNSVSKNETRIKINAKYKFTVADLQWKFVTGGSDSVTLGQTSTAPGANSNRVCQPSYKVEKEFYTAIQGITNK